MAKQNGKNGRNGKARKSAGSKPKKTVRADDGKFLPGTAPGPGRPRGLDYRKVCEEKAAEEGYDLATAIWEVTKEMIENAKGREAVRNPDGKIVCPPVRGDIRAAQVLFDRQCGPMRQEVDITSTSTVYTPDDARKELTDLLDDPKVQTTIRAELKRRTRR